MPLVKVLRSRGANIVITANAETLFGPNGPIPGWTRSMSNRIRGATISEAPSNKRPRWDHYGLPLKRTIRASTSVNPAKLRSYFAVGSTAPYAAFVDQGTGIYNNSSPWEAKILPPWTRGGGSLYEHTWRPPTGSHLARKPVASVEIKGQEAQNFFDKGLKRGMAAMRLATTEIPGDPAALKTFPDRLTNFIGATPNDAAFRAQLKEWRAWRDDAFKRGQLLGPGGRNNRQLARREAAAERKRTERAIAKAKRFANSSAKTSAQRGIEYRDRMAEKKGKAKPKRAQDVQAREGFVTVAAKKDAAVAQFLAQNPQFAGKVRRTVGGIVVPVNGRPQPIPWSALYGLL